MNILRNAWANRPQGLVRGLFRKNPSCGQWRPWNRVRYWWENEVWEVKMWLHQDVMGHNYTIEYLFNSEVIGSDYNLSKKEAIAIARSYSFMDTWAITSARVYADPNTTEPIYDTTIPRPTEGDVRGLTAGYESPRDQFIIDSLNAYADKIKRQQE